MVEIVVMVIALVLGVIGVIRSRGNDLAAWGVAFLAGLLLSRVI